MNAGSPAARLAEVVEMLRYADVLAAVAEQLKLRSHVAELRSVLKLAQSGPLEELLPIIVQSFTCVHDIAGQLAIWLKGAKAQVQQHHAQFNALSAELEQVQAQLAKAAAGREGLAQREEQLQEKLRQLTAMAEKELRFLAALEDCQTEVQWCRSGMATAWEGWQSGRRGAPAPFPTRSMRHGGEYKRWIESLRAPFEAAGKLLPQDAQRLQAVLARLQAPTATVTFGGRFKSGKSSLLNAALGRPLLPTKDLPETGANCHMSAGERDEAHLISGGQRLQIACETEALRAAISLRGGRQGAERVADLQRLELRIANFPGGPHVQWIDPPGMFDRPEMTERAWDAARRADVMVWVLRSQQFLGEAEADAVAQFIRERGPAAIVFVENAFLPSEAPDPWAYHLTEIAPVSQGKLKHLANELGVTSDELPPLVVVSADDVLRHGHGYGAGELRRLLGRLASPDCPLIRRARLQWMQRELAHVIAAVRAQWQTLCEENERRRVEWERQQAALNSVRARFEAEVREVVSGFFIQFDAAAALAGEGVAGQIAADLTRDNTYESSLHGQLCQRAAELCDALLRSLRNAATQRQQSPLASAMEATLRSSLMPARVTVSVANNSISGASVAVGAGTGAAIGVWFFGIGAPIGAAIGGGLAALGSGKAAYEKDCADTKANIRAAAASSAARLRSEYDATIKRVLETCRPLAEPSVSAPDLRRQEALFQLYQSLDAAARMAAEWIRREAVA